MSYRLIDSNELVDKVDFETQDIVNNMDCVYVDGIELSNQHFNLEEHDVKVRADCIDDLFDDLERLKQQKESCNLCEKRLPYNTDYGAIWIDKTDSIGKLKWISKQCSSSEECLEKNTNIVNAIKIKYCPVCGKKII